MRLAITAHALVAALTLLAGCNFAMRRTLDNTGHNEAVRVESGERLYLELEEEPSRPWQATCTDPDVLVKINHIPADEPGEMGLAKVEVRIHRGYDGPSEVKFRCGRKGRGREFTLALFKRTGDCAFWE